MTVTAIEMRNRAAGKYPWLNKTSKGYYGARFYRADTADPVEAANALGLPALGSTFSADPELADCILVSIKQDFQGGRDSASSKGTMFYDLEYQPRSVAPIDSVAQLDTSHSEMSSTTTQVRVRSTAGGSPARIPETSAEAGTVELLVRSYKNTRAALSAFVAIKNKINSNSVAIPASRSVPGTGFTATAGQLIARDFSERIVRDGLIEFTFTFGYGPAGSFLYRYQPEDQNGNPVGSAQTVDIQGTVAYPAPGVLW